MDNVSGLAPAAKTIYIATMMNQLPSIQALAARTGMDPEPVIKHCKALERLGWLQLIPEGKKLRPAAIVPREVETAVASEVRDLIGISHFKGEETTKAFIDWTVAPTVRLIYGARPSFLLNPETGQNLEYDIFSPKWLWATEYQGDQHFGPTKQYPGEKEFIDRFRRDLLKAQLSKQNKVRLSTVTKHDLTLENILAVIPDDVPRRAFDANGPFVQMLERLGKEIAGRRDRDRDRE